MSTSMTHNHERTTWIIGRLISACLPACTSDIRFFFGQRTEITHVVHFNRGFHWTLKNKQNVLWSHRIYCLHLGASELHLYHWLNTGCSHFRLLEISRLLRWWVIFEECMFTRTVCFFYRREDSYRTGNIKHENTIIEVRVDSKGFRITGFLDFVYHPVL
jgi:hypothetical protein